MKNDRQWKHVVVLMVASWAGAQIDACADIVGVQTSDFQQKTIYHFQPDPSWNVLPYTAWVGLWKMPNGTIQCDFDQGNGPKTNPSVTNPVLQSTDNGRTWTGPTYLPTGYSHGMAVIPGVTPNSVTMVRPADIQTFAPSTGHPNICQRRDSFFGIERSVDGGATWSAPVNLVSPDQYQLCWPTVVKPLKDGRLVAMAGVVPKGIPAAQVQANVQKLMFLSEDQGQSWTSGISIVPVASAACEESDLVELPNGNLLWVHRAQHWGTDGSFGAQTRVQSISRKVGNTFVSEPPTACPLPPGGFPCDLMTKEGVILDLGGSGCSWSGDEGRTWHDLIVGGQRLSTPYYPQAVQTSDGTIVIVGHVGSDDSYGTVDQSIVMQSFRLDVVHLPEPGSMTLFGIASAGVLAYARCWRRRAT